MESLHTLNTFTYKDGEGQMEELELNYALYMQDYDMQSKLTDQPPQGFFVKLLAPVDSSRWGNVCNGNSAC
jgi:hypothetical protein